MQIPYNRVSPYPPGSIKQLARFYEDSGNRTPTVIVHRVQGFPIVNPLGEGFDIWYEAEPTHSFETPGGKVEIYRLK